MPIDTEPTVLLRTIAICGVAIVLIAKICHECGLDALRRRLQTREAELLEFARLGQLRPSDPAYAMLRDSIRNLARFSYRISLTRYLAAILVGRAKSGPAMIDSMERMWAQALDRIDNTEVRNEIAALRQRLLMDVICHVALGAVPLAPKLLSGAILPKVPDRIRSAAIRGARLVEVLAGVADRWPKPAWCG